MRRTSALLTAAFAALMLGQARGQNDAASLLRAAVDAPKSVSFVGQVESTAYGQSRSDAVVYRIEHHAPGATRRWYLAPQALYGDSMIAKGAVSYNVDVRHARIVVTKDDAIDDEVALDDNFGLLLNNYRAIPGPDDTVANRRVITILLDNKYTGQTVMRVSLDAQTKLVLQKETYGANGSVIEEMRFDQLRYVKDVPDEVFAVPTKGYRRLQGAAHGTLSADLPGVVRTAGFQAQYPRSIPEGFVPVAGTVSDIKGVRSLHVLYSDGIRTVSLFENARGAAVDLSRYRVRDVKVGSYAAQAVEEGPTTLLSWAGSGLHYALVGELPRTDLLKIASSITP